MTHPPEVSISRPDPDRGNAETVQVSDQLRAAADDSYTAAGTTGDDLVSEPMFGEPTRCARSECGRRLPPRTGPGRPRRFCSASCRHAARREERPAETRGTARPRLRSRFGAALRAAVARSGMSLQEISDSLAELDGVTVSRSTLSNWQCGREPHRGSREDQRVYGLERVLQLRRGELLLLLEDPNRGERPELVGGDTEVRSLLRFTGQLGGTASTITIAVNDVLHVVDGSPQKRTVTQKVRAIARNADCYWSVYAPDAAGPRVPFKPLRGCRLGRVVPRGELIAIEWLFDRVLEPGETHEFSFEFDERKLEAPVRECRRWAGPPALETLRMSVVFDRPPREVLDCEWPRRGEQPHIARPVPVIDGVARIRRSHPVAGMYGLSWRW